jgi:hypothetical protein
MLCDKLRVNMNTKLLQISIEKKFVTYNNQLIEFLECCFKL